MQSVEDERGLVCLNILLVRGVTCWATTTHNPTLLRYLVNHSTLENRGEILTGTSSIPVLLDK